MRPSTHTPELKDSLPNKKDMGACPTFQGLKKRFGTSCGV